jgi:hypothetical protein
MKKLRESRITAKDLIEADWGIEATTQTRLELPRLDTIMRIPTEFRVGEDSEPHLYLQGLLMQLLLIPEAGDDLMQRLNRFRIGPGRNWQEEIRKLKASRQPTTLAELRPFTKFLNRQQMPMVRKYAEDKKYPKDIRRIFRPWVKKWAHDSHAMLMTVHDFAILAVSQLETYTEQPRTRNRISWKGLKSLQKALWGKLILRRKDVKDENMYVKIMEPPVDQLIKFIAAVWGKPSCDHWHTMLAFSLKSVDDKKAMRHKTVRAIRKEARKTLALSQKLITSHTIIRAEWCFVKLVVLSKEKTPEKELYRLIKDGYPLPFDELKNNVGVGNEELRRYMRPVFEALAWKPPDGIMETLGLNS